jgi:four helix bundle protein
LPAVALAKAGHGARGTEHRARSSGLRAQGSEHGAQSSEHRAKSAGIASRSFSGGWAQLKRWLKDLLKIVMEDFRFEQLDIWKESNKVSDFLFDFADKADDKRLYKFAEQLRAAAMSISNNIAEGSGSFSDKEFANFLNISRRSIFECANVLHIFQRRKIITSEERQNVYPDLIVLSKKITNFRKSLK